MNGHDTFVNCSYKGDLIAIQSIEYTVMYNLGGFLWSSVDTNCLSCSVSEILHVCTSILKHILANLGDLGPHFGGWKTCP